MYNYCCHIYIKRSMSERGCTVVHFKCLKKWWVFFERMQCNEKYCAASSSSFIPIKLVMPWKTHVNTLKDMEMRTDWQAHLRLAINVSVLWTQCSRFFLRPSRRCSSPLPSSHCKAKTATCHWKAWDGCWAVFSVRASQEEKRTPFDLFHLNECLFLVETISDALVSAAPPSTGQCRSHSIHPHQPALHRH